MTELPMTELPMTELPTIRPPTDTPPTIRPPTDRPSTNRPLPKLPLVKPPGTLQYREEVCCYHHCWECWWLREVCYCGSADWWETLMACYYYVHYCTYWDICKGWDCLLQPAGKMITRRLPHKAAKQLETIQRKFG